MATQWVHARDINVSLIEGVEESPPFATFLRQLAARTGARRAAMVVSLAGTSPEQAPKILHVAAPGDPTKPTIDLEQLAALGLPPVGMLRPNRVYAIDELLDFDQPAVLVRQRKVLDEIGVRYGRWIRLSTDGIADAWIIVAREYEDFSSSAVSALSATAQPLAAALRMFAALSGYRLQAAMAHSALDKLGIGQVALDQNGRVMAADPVATAHLAIIGTSNRGPGLRLQLPIHVQLDLEAACHALAHPSPGKVAPMTIPISGNARLLLRTWDIDLPEADARPKVIGTLRLAQREDERRGAQLLRQLHDLSENEAALAQKLSRGRSIVEAGDQLRLTDETARNYSKRIYAKTGTRGQADLVRAILTGLAPLA